MTSMYLFYDGNVFSFWIQNHFGIFGGYKVNNDSSFNEKKIHSQIQYTLMTVFQSLWKDQKMSICFMTRQG